MSQKVVTISKVKTPWYAAPFLLRKAFKKSIPEYAKIPGLEFKYYATTNHSNLFGGIYLWTDLSSAMNQFNATWFSKVSQKYNTNGIVEYFNLVSETSFVYSGFNYNQLDKNPSTLFVRHLSLEEATKLSTKNEGLQRVYLVKDALNYGIILLFETNQKAILYLKNKKITNYEVFKTPVLLENNSVKQ